MSKVTTTAFGEQKLFLLGSRTAEIIGNDASMNIGGKESLVVGATVSGRIGAAVDWYLGAAAVHWQGPHFRVGHSLADTITFQAGTMITDVLAPLIEAAAVKMRSTEAQIDELQVKLEDAETAIHSRESALLLTDLVMFMKG